MQTCITCEHYRPYDAENHQCNTNRFASMPNEKNNCSKFILNERNNMHDSGERKEQSTGALSDPSHANAAMELLSPYSLWQLSTWLGKGAEKYAPRNWEKGIPFSVCIGKMMRHLAEYEMGKTDEPHLDAIGFWWHALTHYEAMIALGKLPASLNDLPQYEKEFVCPEGWMIALNLPHGWYVCHPNYNLHQDEYLRPDNQLHSGTGCDSEAPGYWPTKQEAEAALAAYLEKTKGVYCEHCEGKIRRAKNGTAVGLCKECSRL